MHEKWAKDGLVIFTLALDDEENAQSRTKTLASVEKFIADTKPPFRCFNLKVDPKQKLPKTINFGDGMPKGFVFNRENKYTFKMPTTDENETTVDEFSKPKFEKAIEEALKAK